MKKLFLGLLLAVFSLAATADMKLDNESSSLNFVSIKKSAAGEVGTFRSLDGAITGGDVKVMIDLGSVDTNIQIRDDRMKSMLFDVVNFPSATISASVDEKLLGGMKAGDARQETIKLGVALHGMTKEMDAKVQLVKLSDGSVRVNSVHPLIVNAGDFGLADGIEALRKVANLPSISTAVPVTFNLVFR